MLIRSARREETPPVSPEAAQYLARAIGLDALHTAAATELIDGLVRDGIWPRLDVLYIFANQTAEIALLNLHSARFTATVVINTPEFAMDRGYTGVDSSNSTYWLNSNFNMATDSVALRIGDSHLSEYSVAGSQSTANGGIVCGAFNGVTLAEIRPHFSNNAGYFASTNAQAAGVFPALGAIGHYTYTRNPDEALYLNGVVRGFTLNAGSSAAELANLTIGILARNQNGNGLNGSGNQVAMMSAGGGLTAGQAADLYNGVRTYLTAVGAPVRANDG